MFLTASWFLDMIIISTWIWYTYYVIRAIDLRFAERRWYKERELEAKAMYEVDIEKKNVVN
tara:strand:+ start:148 stop:330 length:183 start_codon:yes stop_codon:yes gene_type:complete